MKELAEIREKIRYQDSKIINLWLQTREIVGNNGGQLRLWRKIREEKKKNEALVSRYIELSKEELRWTNGGGI